MPASSGVSWPPLDGVSMTGPTRRKPELATIEVESRPSSWSAFRLATLVGELTVKGAWPLATLRPSAVALAPVFVLVTWSAFDGNEGEALSDVGALAVFDWPSVKGCPVAA